MKRKLLHHIQRAVSAIITAAIITPLIAACVPQERDLTTIPPTPVTDSSTPPLTSEPVVEPSPTSTSEPTTGPPAGDTGTIIVTFLESPPPSDSSPDVYVVNVDTGVHYHGEMPMTAGLNQLTFEVSPGNYQVYAFVMAHDASQWYYGYWQPGSGLRTFTVTSGTENTEPSLTLPSDPCAPEFYVPASPDGKYPATGTDWYLQRLSCPYESAELDPDAWYRLAIVGFGDEYALETYGQGDTPVLMAPVVSSDGGDTQAWKFTPVGNDYYRLTNRSLGEQWSLGVIEDGRPFMVSTDDDERQYWQVRPSRDAPGFYRLVNVSQLGPISETEMPYANGGSTEGLWKLTPIGTQTSDTELVSIIQVDVVGIIESPDLRMVRFSPDGETIAAPSGGSEANFAVRVWQTTDGALLQTFDQYTGIVWEIAFSPDGQTIVSVSSDQDNELHVWQLADGALLQAFDEPGFTASSVAFSPDGKTLAVGGVREWPNGIVQLYDTSNWSVVRELPAPGQNVTTLAFSPDGSMLVGAGTDGNIRLWEVSDGTLLNTLYHARQANAVAISPDGTLLATAFCALWGDGCEQGGTVVWQISEGTTVRQFDDLAESVAFSPDGKILVSGSGQNDPYIRLRSVEDWSLLSVVDGPAFSLDFSPDGTLLATSDSSAISIWKIGR